MKILSKLQREPGKERRLGRVKPLPYVLIFPAMALFTLFTFYPFIKTIVLSFALTNKQGNFTQWVGPDNWIRVLTKDSFWDVVAVTLKMAAINLFFTFIVAMIFALMATKKVRFSKVYQTMYALPMAIASSPAAAIFLFIYRQKNGLLNNILGTEIAWTNEMPHAIWAVCAMTIWMHIGVSFIFLLVGFRNVPEDLLESALLDGAGPFRRIKDIIIPMASPQIFFVLFLNIGSSFKSFAQIRLLTQGGPANQTKTLIYYIYENAIINGRFETACVQALFLFGLIFLFTRIQFALEKKVVHYQ
ncbi:sn-glycerol-3-phosphate transport system permease protein ugpA [uncultured Clostridium sp.]|nr:sn-glycerol-3-phosphate transport system permease protein ugpA [uncultured Clostridium sp.]SCI60846.1 sn-glycerol-3-phosphate transport system permease protein ugpA [uncultured Flavonifractor sp.]